jgi:hypothetical protein
LQSPKKRAVRAARASLTVTKCGEAGARDEDEKQARDTESDRDHAAEGGEPCDVELVLESATRNDEATVSCGQLGCGRCLCTSGPA